MTQYAFYLDAENCIGCHTCQIACKDVHGLKVKENFRTVSTYSCGNGYSPMMYHISMGCNHCENPVCMDACSVDAMFRDDMGLIQIIDDCCIGCGDCISACPYGAITMIADTRIAAKCDGCRTLIESGEQAACVASCLQRVLEFGPIEELQAKHAMEKLVTDAAALPSSGLTSPNLLMRIKDCMIDPDYDRIVI
ncbi:MAG: 4Fe-4S dicluster domain-containing protein [Coriobacteriaceae bacterium]|nr:4Fe-4S dicluster domain-containing protein [Coriobacteriaceae bacterium]